MIIVNNIYELEEEEKVQNKKIKSQIIERKLGTVTYIKWGAVHNYHFSFDTAKGRLLCYKTAQTKKPTNYYSLIQGSFIEDNGEIQKKEAGYQKKKNYIPQKEQSTIYVKTKKGKTFRLIVSENESLDKIMGYLQICFQSKIETKSFFALLGMVKIEVNMHTYKLMTGILVALDDWRSSTYNQNYLQQQQGGSQIISQNIAVLSAIVSIFQQDTYLGIVFNPIVQTLDIVKFDENLQPTNVFKKVFILTKNQQVQQNNFQHQQFMKLNTIVQVDEEDQEYDQLFSNQELKVHVHRGYNLNYMGFDINMYQLLMQEEINEDMDDQESSIVNSCLDFYKKQMKHESQEEEDSKEFIILRKISEMSSPTKLKPLESNPISQEFVGTEGVLIQPIKCVNVKMKKQREKNQQIQIKLQQSLEYQLEKKVSEQKRNSILIEKPKETIIQEQKIEFLEEEDQYECCQITGTENIMDYAIKFKFIEDSTDFRHSSGYKNGGVMCVDKELVNKLRNIGKQMIKEIGRKIISGNFNLTTVSFPV